MAEPESDAEDAEGPELADSDVEEADIEAYARTQLKPGEEILGPGVPPDKVESRGVCNAPLLLQKLKDISYKVPEGAKRIPWVDTLCIDGLRELPKDVKAKDGVKLEGSFLKMAQEGAQEAYRRLKVMRIPCSRPSDFYAEMLRSDSLMYKVRARAAEETRRINIVEERKKAMAAKKFAKKSKTHKLEARAKEKRQTLDDIADWRKQDKKDKRSMDDANLEDILNRRKSKDRDEDEGPGAKRAQPKKSNKRKALDVKYGFGGKKKRSKSNTLDSTNDFSASPWSKKGKGKGKGKSKAGGSKGKGKGGGSKGKSKGGFGKKKRR